VPPPQKAILFVGSSSFNYWKDIINYFPGYPIINRGFGGSTLLDVQYYINETIIKYRPKKIFIYCGENDLAESDTVSPATVSTRFKSLYFNIRNALGKNVEINFVSIKPSVARWKLESRMVETNRLIELFLKHQKNTHFIDVHHAMLDEEGQVFKNIFIQDNLHMNPKGYVIWQKIIAPYLK
jgi:lysophospholipase L1-like esterase